MKFFRKPKKGDKYKVHVDLGKKKATKWEPVSTVFGMNRTQRKNWEFLLQVLRTVIPGIALYLTYKIYVITVLGG